MAKKPKAERKAAKSGKQLYGERKKAGLCVSCGKEKAYLIDEVWLAVTPCWESEDVLFFYELLPELGCRRLMMKRASTSTPEVKVLGTMA